MYGSEKATKPKDIGVKHYDEYECFCLEMKRYNKAIETKIHSIMDKLHNQKANELNEKEPLK